MKRQNRIREVERISLDQIDVGKRLRPVNNAAVEALAESMRQVGQLQPIVLAADDLVLVSGMHRLAAAKHLGWGQIDAVYVTGNEIDREMQEIAENLHRAELTALERDSQIGRWAELTVAKKGVQTEHPSGGHQPHEKGESKVARDLGLNRIDVHRAVKVASISPEAKQAARDAVLDDNRTALLAVAKESTAEAQVAKVAAISKARTEEKKKPAHVIGELKRFAEFCRTNSPASVAAGMLPDEVAEVRDGIAVIDAWLSRFAVLLDAKGGAQ